MAVTKILPIRSTIEKSIAYICNPDKTDGSLLIHSEHCFPQTAVLTFQHHLSKARAGGNTIGRHLIQSFAPGEVDPDTAHEIGKKLAAEILRGEFAYVMATHLDCGHVHNHFIWGAANIVTHKRYRSNKSTYHEIRSISDHLCKENSLSIIVPQGVGKCYTEYQANQQGTSWKAKLKIAIDATISESTSFEGFIKQMEAQGYAIKRGKYISFQAPGQERFTRAKSLGEGYTQESIKDRISQIAASKEERDANPVISSAPSATVTPANNLKAMKPLINIESSPKIRTSIGLIQWAKIQNLKNTVEAFNLMQEYGGLKAFNDLYADCRIDIETITNGIKANDERIVALGYWREDILIYNRTKPIYKQYKETKFFKERFREKHEGDIIDHENAAIGLQGVTRPLPKIKTIDTQIAKLKTANNNNNKALTKKKAELKQFEYLHTYLRQLWREHEQPLPQIQQKCTRNNDLSL